MKAIVRDAYGSPDVLSCEEVPRPTPADDQVLVKVHAASANPADWHSLRGEPFLIRLGDGLLRPKTRTLGIDIAGRVEAVGSQVTKFQPGDAVFGACKYAAFAEYACAAEDRLVRKPEPTSFEQAAAVPVAAISALQALRDHGGISAGAKVLINGASGGVGTFAVQIAKAFDAEVTGVCSSRNLQMVRSIGADHVIDYTTEDCTRNGQRYDVILDAAAYRSVADYRGSLAANGRYVMVGGGVRQILQLTLLGPWYSRAGRKMRFMVAKLNQKDLLFLKELLEAGKLAPVIDRSYPLTETPEALRYLEEGHARGKVIITM